jgi:hypothetical protein
MSGRAAAVLLGLAALIVGAVLQFTAVHIDGGDSALSCGSAASPRVQQAISQATSGDLTTELLTLGGSGSLLEGTAAEVDANSTAGQIAASCDSALSTRRTWSWALIGLGVVLCAAAAIRRRSPIGTTATP